MAGSFTLNCWILKHEQPIEYKDIFMVDGKDAFQPGIAAP
jgi:hypothetical protein